jgi:hypothetical protein
MPKTVILAVTLGVFVLLDRPAFAAGLDANQQPSQATTTDSLEDAASQKKRQALEWLDRYLTVQVLFNGEDLEKLKARVAKMSPGELDNWIQETSQVRAQLQSAEWQETRVFLRDFLAKQAIYSDEQIRQFRAGVAKMSPGEISELLERIQREHRSLLQARQASQRQRRETLASMEEYRQQEEAKRQRRQEQLLAARANYLRSQKPAKRTAAKYGHLGSDHRFYGSALAYAPKQHPKRRRYHVPPPLITSREVARWSVRRSLFGRWYWGW